MCLVGGIDLLEVVHPHVQGLLVLPNALHFADELGALDLIPLDRLDYEVNRLALEEILRLVEIKTLPFSA